MTGLFEGQAGLLSGMFGGSVSHQKGQAAPIQIEARFRRKPIEVLEEDGTSALLMHPSLRVTEPVASTIEAGDLVTPEHGVTYRILNRHPSGSPASDAFVIFELREDPA